MGKTLLVATDFSIGEKMLVALDAAGLSVSVAAWIYATEYEDWRFYLAGRSLELTTERRPYRKVHEALEAAGISYDETPPLVIMSMKDPLIRDLRRKYAKSKYAEGARLGPHPIGDTFVEDGLVLRIK
jgi:hypothetical protein